MLKRLLLALALLAAPIAALAQGVSAADPRAAQAGVEILREGGTAADAAFATMLALTVVEPQSSGIGGGGFLVYHDQRRGRLTSFDGRETAPHAATPAYFLGADGRPRRCRIARARASRAAAGRRRARGCGRSSRPAAAARPARRSGPGPRRRSRPASPAAPASGRGEA